MDSSLFVRTIRVLNVGYLQVCIRPVNAVNVPLALMESANQLPSTLRRLPPLRKTGFADPGHNRSPSLFFPLQTLLNTVSRACYAVTATALSR